MTRPATSPEPFKRSPSRWIGERLQHGGLRLFNVVSGLLIGALGLWQLGVFVRTLR